MKYYSTQTTFQWPIDDLVCVFWQRYPNPYAKHVLSEDVLSREVVGDTIRTKRLLVKSSPMPKWGEVITTARNVAIVEDSVFDRVSRTLTTYTRNVAMAKMLSVEERCVYGPDGAGSSNNTGNTLLSREAWFDSQVPGFSRAVQRYALTRFKFNCSNATKGFIHKLTERFGAPATPPTSDCQKKSSQGLKSKLDDSIGMLKHSATLNKQVD
uniref:PRELI/MSF1 domain-containing protein n=1 Tax=Plectus sambesii TaxID=2011161 RepID=A0A914UJT7_9BILA